MFWASLLDACASDNGLTRVPLEVLDSAVVIVGDSTVREDSSNDDTSVAPVICSAPVLLDQRTNITLASGEEAGISDPVVGALWDTTDDGVVDLSDQPYVVVAAGDSMTLASVYAIQVATGASVQLTDCGAGGVCVDAASSLAIGDVDGDGGPNVVAQALHSSDTSRIVAISAPGSTAWLSPEISSSDITSTGGAPTLSRQDDGSVIVGVGRVILAGGSGAVLGVGQLGVGSARDLDGQSTSVFMDLDGDGVQDLVVGDSAYRLDGSALWASTGADGYVAIGTFDFGLGVIVASSGFENQSAGPCGSASVRAMTGSGELMWGPIGLVASSDVSCPSVGRPTLADIDQDGFADVLVTSGSELHALSGIDGSELFVVPMGDGLVQMESAAAVADLDGDGLLEFVVGDLDGVKVRCLADGSLLGEWDWSDPDLHSIQGAVALADADGDGFVDIVSSYQSSRSTQIVVLGSVAFASGRPVWNQQAFWGGNVAADGDVGGIAEQQGWDGLMFRGFAR